MSGNHDSPCLKGGWHAWIGDDAGDSWCEKCGEPLWEKDEAKATSPLVAGKDYEDINTATNKELRGELIAAHGATPRQDEAKQSSPLVVTRNGVPCEDQAAALEEFKQACRPRLEPEDYERIRETLESLNEYPTEEETEAILRKHGTSGKEVINQFIERTLREHLMMRAEVDYILESRRFADAVVDAAIEWHESDMEGSMDAAQKLEDAIEALTEFRRKASIVKPR